MVLEFIAARGENENDESFRLLFLFLRRVSFAFNPMLHGALIVLPVYTIRRRIIVEVGAIVGDGTASRRICLKTFITC